MLVLVVLLIGVLAASGVFAYLLSTQRQGRPEVAVHLLVVALVAESLLYQRQGEIPVGLFRPGPLRLSELILIAGVAARVLARPLSPRLTRTGLLLTVFLGWYATNVALGFLDGHREALVLFQAKLLIHLGLGYALVAGVPAHRLIERRAVRRLAATVGAALVVLIPTSYLVVNVDVPIPGLRVPSLGTLHPDGGTFLMALGFVVLLVEGASRRRRTVVVLSAALMLASPFVVDQRAAVVGLAVSVLALLAASRTRRWRTTIRFTGAEIGLVMTGIAFAIVLVSFISVSQGQPDPLIELYEDTFEGTELDLSTQARGQLRTAGVDFISERPLLGWGIAQEFEIRNIFATSDVKEGGDYHNVPIDVAVRTGLLGLGLLVAVLVSAAVDGTVAWRRAPPRVAALAMAALVVLAGWLVKAQVESILEKHKLGTLLGLLLGVLTSTRLAVDGGDTGPTTAPDPERGLVPWT